MELQEGEVLILDGMGEYFKNFWKIIDGTFYLTNRRLAFYEPPKGFKFLLGSMANTVKGTIPVLELQLTDIKSIKQEGSEIFDFVTSSGKYNFRFRKNEVWINAIRKAIKEAKPGKAQE